MIKNLFRNACLVAAIASVASAGPASADYPERAVAMIVPFAAGGNSDILARIVADHLSKELGKPVVIDNRGGGGGTIGAQAVATAEPDGHTLLFATAGTHSVNPNIKKTPYDPIEDFSPISMAVDSSVLIVVHPRTGVKTLGEFVELTRKGKKQLNYASGGSGTVAHVAGELFNEYTGASLIHVPYKGAGLALNDLLAGRVDVYMNNIPNFLPHVKSGAVVPLALAAPERSALLPEVPTTTEAGLPQMQFGSWYGVLAPKGTPEPVVARVHQAMQSMANSAEVKERMASIGAEVKVSATPTAFRDHMRQQLTWWGEVLNKPAFKQ